jgi:hypothetical protein
MGPAIPAAVTVTPAELTGVLVWWGVMLVAAPAMLLRRWRRRHGRIWPLAVRVRHAKTSPPSPDGRPSAADGPQPAPSAGADDETRSSAGVLRSGGHTPPHRAGLSHAASTPGLRLSTETFEPLCRYVDFRRRLELAVAELQRILSQLPGDRWRIEPYPLTGERRNTLLVLGETGVFVISATYAPGHWDDVVAASKLAQKVQLLLLGYPGQVQPAICHPFTSARPRLWHPSRRARRLGRSVGARRRLGDRLA